MTNLHFFFVISKQKKYRQLKLTLYGNSVYKTFSRGLIRINQVS